MSESDWIFRVAAGFPGRPVHNRKQPSQVPATDPRRPVTTALSRWLAALVLSFVALTAAAAPRELWRLDNSAGAVKAHRPGVHALRFDSRALAAWPIGEAGTLALPGGRTYEIVADRVEAHQGGNRSWIGRFEADGASHVAVLTYGPAGLVGEVRAPDGVFILAIEGAQSVLVDTREGGWQVPPVSGSDAIVPSHVAQATGAPAHGPAPELKATPSPQITIDVLFAYTDGLVAREGSVPAVLLRLDQLIAVANQAYAASEVAITLRLVHAIQVAYTDMNSNTTALDDLTSGAGALAPAKGTLRDRYGADIVVLARPFKLPQQEGCGVGWIGGYGNNGANIGAQAGAGFAVVSDGRVDAGNGNYYYCPSSTFPHEVGHVMGAMHDIQTVTASAGPSGTLEIGAYNYAYGYTHNAQFSSDTGMNGCADNDGACFGTVMSYISANQALRFSNPLQTGCGNGLPCGSALADITRTFNNTRIGVAGWRATKVPFAGAQQGTPQVAAASTPFAQSLRVVVRDATNALVPGVTVRFLAPAAGASAVLSATSAVTDVNGVAQVTATANATAGAYTVTAIANPDFVATAFSFQLTNQGVVTVPGAPSIIAVAAGNAAATVAFAAPASDGGTPITGYAVVSTPAGGVDLNAGSTQMSHVITGLANGVAYRFTVVATNAKGPGPVSAASGGVTPSGGVQRTATVTRTGSGSGTVTSADQLIRCGSSCAGAYPNGATLTLVATASPGSVFVGWLGDCTGQGACVLSLDRDQGVSAAFAPAGIALRADIDGNGRYEPLTDGVMMVRYLFGLTGASLTEAAIGAAPVRSTPEAVFQYLNELRPLLDIDGNGRADALSDGVLLLRYLFGVRGAPLVANAVGLGATRATAAQIETYIRSLLP